VTLLSLLTDRDPDSVAAIDADVPVTTRELLRRTLTLRADLAAAGIVPGDCVAVWLPNWSEALSWQFATASLGAHVIGVNTRYNVDEVTHVLARARPKVVALARDFHGLDLAGRLRAAVERSGVSPVVVPVTRGTGDVRDEPLPEPVPDALAVAFTTSGSTGAPKLAAHTASAVAGHARADAAAIGIRPGDVVLCALPLSGVFGFNTAMAALAAGATCLLEPVFDPAAVLAAMVRERVTHVVGGDDMVGRLADAWRGADLSAWRWLGIADFQGRTRELAEWARREFGTLTSGVYGSSEVFALTTLWPQDEPVPRRWQGGGRPVSPRIEARAADPVTGQPVPDGEQGELQLRGPNVVDAYLGDTDAAARAFTDDGWFRTGDLAEIDADGGIRYVCRMGDVLRLRGFLVDPAEIEHRLAEHESVEVAKVVGIRGDDGADEAVGFVVLAPGACTDGEQLRAWCGRTLARFKVPSAIHVIDEMPTTSGTNGTKIRAAALREEARRRHDAAGEAVR